jgi:hypothetical protein
VNTKDQIRYVQRLKQYATRARKIQTRFDRRERLTGRIEALQTIERKLKESLK